MSRFPEWARSVAQGLLASLQNEAMPDTQAPRRVADQFGQWAAHLSKNALSHWGPYLLHGEYCVFCDEDALGECIACGDPCCLGHAHVSHRGELLCDECVDKALGRSKKQTKTQKAFSYFNLTAHATLDEVTAVYRVRSKGAHPDRGGSGMKELNHYYDVLKEYFERRAA